MLIMPTERVLIEQMARAVETRRLNPDTPSFTARQMAGE